MAKFPPKSHVARRRKMTPRGFRRKGALAGMTRQNNGGGRGARDCRCLSCPACARARVARSGVSARRETAHYRTPAQPRRAGRRLTRWRPAGGPAASIRSSRAPRLERVDGNRDADQPSPPSINIAHRAHGNRRAQRDNPQMKTARCGSCVRTGAGRSGQADRTAPQQYYFVHDTCARANQVERRDRGDRVETDTAFGERPSAASFQDVLK